MRVRGRQAAADIRTATAAASEIGAAARLVVLGEGLYALRLAPGGARPGGSAGLRFPAVQIGTPPSDEHDPVELVAGSGERSDWLDTAGSVAVVKSPPGGGVVLLTTYGPPGVVEAAAVEINRLDAPARGAAAATGIAPVPAALPGTGFGRELRSEVVLHIEREGDRRFVAAGWVGTRGGRRRIEAFSVRPLEGLAPADIEYKAFGPNGQETPWVSDARLCGTRGRGLPLTGFAVRLAPQLRDRFDVIYQGAFFDSGVSGPQRNGEPCRPAIFDDPLEAIDLRVIAREPG